MLLKNLISSPGEAASALGLVALAVITPWQIEPSMGSLVLVPGRWQPVFYAIAGFSIAVGVAQLCCILIDWRIGRLRVARAAAVAWCFLAACYGSIRFLGVVTFAATMILENVLDAWKLTITDEERQGLLRALSRK